MAKNNNVETHKKNTKIENEKSSELKPKETTKKKKLRLHSHLRVNIPLFQSLMMILPSLAKHAEATEESGDTAHDKDLTTTSVADETIVDKHANATSLEATHQTNQTNESQESPNTKESQVPHGANTHLVPSHHLSTLSHPQVHYIPSVSMPTISAGGNGQPTHSNTPPTPTTPVTFIPEVIKGTYGELHVDVNGQYTFVLNPNSPRYILLNQHQQGTDHFALHLSNGASIVVQVPVTGKQDLPSISGDLTGVVTEDHNIDSQGLLHANGKIDVVDPDQNESSVTPEVISGKYGSLTIDANGHWQYQVDNSLSNVQALTGATSLHESFTIRTKDGTPQTIDMTIGGNDDNAVITGVDAGPVIEDLATQVQGQLSVTDPDLGEAHFQASQVNGHLGTLTITKDGAWTYDLDNYSPYVQRLAQGSTATDIITVHSTDGTAHQVTITINGTNDSAVITNNTGSAPNSFFAIGKSTHSNQVIEDHKLTVSGQLSISDIDAKEAHFSDTDLPGKLGTLHLKDNGAWAYDLDNTNPTVQALGKGSTATDTVTVHSADGTSHQVTIIINGTNDKAVIGGTSSGAVTEEAQLQTSGTLTVTDVDTGEAHFSNTDVAGALGTLHLKDNGAWTYDLDNTNPTVQALGQGSTAKDTVTVHSADGTSHQVTIIVNGTNDRPTISGTSSGAVIEQGLNTAGKPDAIGSLIATDIDKSDTITWAINQPQGQWGTLSIDQNGHWHYQLDNSTGGAADKLAAGEHQSESFWITATDSAGATVPHKIVIDVQGSNDKPIVSAWTQLPAGKEDQPVTIKASDLLTHASDVDSSDVLHVTNLHATHGSLTDNKDGTYTFTPDKDFNGEIRLTYDVVDGHGGSVSTQAKFDLTATPDNAIITDAQTNADLRGVTEDRGYIDTHYQLHYDGKLNIQDPDAGEAQFDPNIGPQTYQGYGYDTKLGGHILLMRDGHYTYTLDNRNIQNLAQGEVKHDSAVIRSADGTTHTIELTVHGTNDAPTINAQSHSVTEGGSVLNGQMVGHDIDTGATLTYSAPQIDGLVVNPDGSYAFNPAHSSYQSLASGVTKTLTVPVTVTDEHNASSTQNLSITITGVNNSAVIGGVDVGDIVENQAGVDRSPDYAHPGDPKLFNDLLTASGDLTIRDADSGESHFQQLNGGTPQFNGSYGHLYIQENGHWLYVVNVGDSNPGRAIDALGKGDTLTDTITVYSKDGTSHDIVITIHGSNDRPYCASEVQLNSGKEDLAQTITATELLANTVDVDANDAGKLTIANLHADHGSIQDNHDGTYTFTPTKDYSGQVHFTYDVTDAHGGITATGANLHLQATGDAATITGIDQGNVTEDRGYIDTQYNLHFDGKLDIVDPDQGEAQFDIQRGYTYHGIGYDTKMGGWVLLQQDGTYTYTIDNRKPEIQNLGSTETLVDKVTIHSVDGTSHEIQITIHGTNDDPKVSSVTTLPTGTEDTDVVLHASDLLANATDIDHNDVGKLSVANLIADHGNITDNHDGTFTFHPSQDYNGKVSFTYDVQDAHGGSVSTSASITLAPTRDSAVISGDNTGTIIEDHNVGHSSLHPVAASGLLRVTDPDAGQDHFQVNRLLGEQAIHDPFGGFLRITPNGAWGYEVANSRLQSLAEGEVEKVVYRVYSADHTSHDITITVTGTNDRPTITATTLAHGTEDTHYQMQASQFGFTDVDTGDTLHSIAITDLPPAAQGKFVLDGHDITAGQSIAASAIAKLQFIPATDFNGDVQFKFTVNDGHVDSQEATNTLHIDAVSDAAQFTGRDTGDVHEGHTYTAPDGSMSGGYVDDRSPDHMHGNIGKIWNDEIHTDGHLDIVDPDSGESRSQTGIYQGTHGHVILQSNGDWSYYASIGQDATGRRIDHLGQGESITDTITVRSADGTTHDIHITIHGDNDSPYCSSEVQLNSGKEDLAQTITTTELLANTVDVDANDAGKLTIANLHADHGTIVDNQDGTFTFTPNHNYNGQVHFTYDVKDAHGGITHTGASATLLPNNDAATLQPTLASNFVTEDHLKSGTSTNELWSGWKNLDIQDIDSPSEAKVTQIEVNGVKHTVPANFAMNLAGVHGTFNFTHSTDGHDKWSYSADNSHAEVQSLSHGESLTDTITLITADGTRIPLTTKILGTDDHVIIDTPDALTAALGTAVEDKVTSISGTLLAHDSDSKDSVTFTAGNSVGSYGTLHVDSDGQWHYDLDHSKANTLQQGEAKAEGFDITAISSDGSTATKHVEVLVQGSSDTATISVMSNPDVHEDSSSTPVEMISGKLSALDPDHDQSAFSTDVGKRHDPFNSGVHGGLHISKDGSWTYTVNNNQIQQLAAGQEEHVQYNVHTVGGDYHIIDIKIVGTNDIPTVSATTLAHGTEDARYQMQAGQFGFNDVDIGDTLHSIAITALPPAAQGKFVLDGHDITAGQSISASDIAKLQFVPAPDFNGDVQFKFTVSDGRASSAEATNTLHIDAVSDAATITGIDSGSVTEDAHLQTSGSLTVTDSDSGEAHFTATSGSTQLGTYTIDASGHWTYSLNPRIQSLHQGETTPDVFTVHSADGTAHVIKVTITGTQDAPVITGQSTGTVYEDSQTTVSGTLNADDKDYGQSGFWAQSHIASAHNFGDLSIDQNGYWTFHLDSTNPAVNALGEHDTLQETVTINTIDGTSKVIQITINGTNDAPILGVSQTSSTTGTLTETDVDVSDTHTFSVVHATGQFGSLSVDPDSGAYIYTANGSVAGMSYNTATHTYHGTDVFEVKVADNHGGESSKFITFDANGHVSVIPGQSPTISTSVPSNPLVTSTQPSLPTGTNTPPNNAVTVDLAASSDTGTSDTDNLTKDSTPTITGHTVLPYSQVSIYDGSTPIGRTVSDGSGQYSVAVSNLSNGDHNLSAKALAPSSVLPATSSILSLHVDTLVAPLQVSLTHDTGSNSSDLITHDGSLTITGQETGATVEYSTDNGHTWTSSFTPQLGSNTVSVRQTDTVGNLSASSSLTFTLDNAATAPSVSLTSDSGSSSSDNITNVGDLNIGGIEQGATVEYSIDNGVHWSTQFTPAEGQNNVQVRQTDAAGNISPSTSLNYTLDTQTDISVRSAIVDKNTHEMMVQVFLPKDSEVTHLEITSDGGGTPLVVDLQSVTQLNLGQSSQHHDHQYIKFQNIDLSSLPEGNLNIHVTGTDPAGNHATTQTLGNYTPLILDRSASVTDDSNTAIEDSTIPVSGNLLSNDADAATVTTIGDIQGTYGVFHLSADGSYTYTLNNQLSVIQQLDSTSSPLVDSIAYTASDNHGNQATAHIAISIQGTDDNHAPVVTTHTVSTDEDTSHTFSTADFGYTDQDGDILHFITISQLPANGLLLLNGKAVTTNQQISKADLDASHLTFTPINNEHGANYAHFEFSANDGHQNSASATMTLNVNAVNDAATFTGDSGSISEDTNIHHSVHTTGSATIQDALVCNGHLVISDADGHGEAAIDLKGQQKISQDGTYGHFTVTSRGTWVYTADNNSTPIQDLDNGQTLTDSIEVTSKDGTKHSITVTINGTTDDPVLHSLSDSGVQHSGPIEGNLLTGSGTVQGTRGAAIDTDSNAHLVLQDIQIKDPVSGYVAVRPGQPHTMTGIGTLAVEANGHYTFTPEAGFTGKVPSMVYRVGDDGGNPIGDSSQNSLSIEVTPVPYTPPTISVTVDTRNAHHVTAGITASTVQAYAHSIGQSARTMSGHNEIEGHGQSEIYIVQGSLHDEAELKSGNDILYIGGRLTDEEIEGGSGRDTLILGAYNRNNAPRLHSDKIGNMEIESIENIILGDGTVLKGHLPPNFPLATHDHYEVPVNIQAHLSSSDESVSSIRLTHLQQGLTLQSNGHNINANQDGSYTVPTNGHLVVVSDHPMNNGHHYFETEVTTRNSVTGVTAVTTEDLHGHIQSHVNPPPPPPPPMQHDEPDLSPLDSVQDFTVTLDDSLSADAPLDNHAQVSREHPVGAAAYLDALGIQPNASPTTGHEQPADMDIVLAQVDQQHAVDYDQTHLDMSDALEHHDAANNHNQDDEHHHHNDVDGLPDIDPNN